MAICNEAAATIIRILGTPWIPPRTRIHRLIHMWKDATENPMDVTIILQILEYPPWNKDPGIMAARMVKKHHPNGKQANARDNWVFVE